MKKLSRVLKQVVYIISIVLPLLDAFKGMKDGVMKGLNDLEKERQEKDYMDKKNQINGGLND